MPLSSQIFYILVVFSNVQHHEECKRCIEIFSSFANATFITEGAL